MSRISKKSNRNTHRRGAVAVEMALIAPVFVTLILGVAEASRWLETQNTLATVAREGARLAALDRSDLLGPGENTNDKIAKDIKNFLTASGLQGDDASVFIVNPTDHTTPMNLDLPANQLELFELRVELPFTYSCGPEGVPTMNLVSKIVFRNAPATYAQ